jgi:hypothetical protein
MGLKVKGSNTFMIMECPMQALVEIWLLFTDMEKCESSVPLVGKIE